MSYKILEMVKVNTVVFNQATMTNATATSTFVDMSAYDRIALHVTVGAITSAPVMTISAWQATTTAGGGLVTVASASTTATLTASTPVQLSLRDTDLDNVNYPTYKYVGFKVIVDTGGTATGVSAVTLRTPARWPQATLAT
jgi:hypothetical protein